MLIPVVYPPADNSPPKVFTPVPHQGSPTPPAEEVPPPPPPPPVDAPPTPEGDVPWTLYLLRVLWLCLFPVGIVIVGVGFLLGVDQAQETLFALEVYSAQTAPLIEFYRGRDQLVAIDALGTVEDVTERAIEALRPFADR